jgi:hypothetical protein
MAAHVPAPQERRIVHNEFAIACKHCSTSQAPACSHMRACLRVEDVKERVRDRRVERHVARMQCKVRACESKMTKNEFATDVLNVLWRSSSICASQRQISAR